MKITPIKDNQNLLRDLDSNAVLFKTTDGSAEKRSSFLRQQNEDINNLKKELSEMKEIMNNVLEIIKKEKSE